MKVHEYRVFVDADQPVDWFKLLGGSLYDYEFIDTHKIGD